LVAKELQLIRQDLFQKQEIDKNEILAAINEVRIDNEKLKKLSV
jgi:hypothetical protein